MSYISYNLELKKSLNLRLYGIGEWKRWKTKVKEVTDLKQKMVSVEVPIGWLAVFSVLSLSQCKFIIL